MPMTGRQRRNAAVAAVALTAGGVIAYKAYTSATTRRLTLAATKYSEALHFGGKAASLLARDMHAFLEGDSDEVPQSFKQAMKLVQSREVTDTTAGLIVAVAQRVGFLAERKGAPGASCGQEGDAEEGAGAGEDSTGALDKVLDKVFSSQGADLASLIIGRAVKDTMDTYFAHEERRRSSEASTSGGAGGATFEGTLPGQLCEFAGSERGRQLVTETVGAFVATAVGTYCDKTANVNYYKDMVEATCNPQYRQDVRELMGVVCREAVTTYVAASRSNLSIAAHPPMDCPDLDEGTVQGTPLPKEVPYVPGSGHRIWASPPPRSVGRGGGGEGGSSGVARRLELPGAGAPWVRDVAEVVRIPEARRFVADVAGAATGEAMKVIVGSVTAPFRAGGSGEEPGVVRVWADAAVSKSFVGLSLCFAILLHIQQAAPTISLLAMPS